MHKHTQTHIEVAVLAHLSLLLRFDDEENRAALASRNKLAAAIF